MNITQHRIELHGITKRFGSCNVLNGIDLTIQGGDVLALMGANGAGKSTLVKILSGVYSADAGEIIINGKSLRLNSPQEAKQAGIVTVHQIINDGVIQNLTVAENLLLDQLCDGRLPNFISSHQLQQRAANILQQSGIALALNKPVFELSQAERQLLAIARALSEHPKMLILDEPTSCLSDQEANRLFDAITRMQQQGVAVIYISHRMSDIRQLANRIASLREGRIVGLFTKPLDYSGAVDAMLGYSVGEVQHQRKSGKDKILQLHQIKLQPNSQPFDLDIYSGEVVALTGLLSSGCAELVEMLFGMRTLLAGELSLDGIKWTPTTPIESIKRGIFMVQEDRNNNAIISDFSIKDNVSFPHLSKFSHTSFIDKTAECEQVKKALELTNVKYTDLHASMSTLSGGNQQKVMMARWMLTPCRVLLLNEPFQGVDISSRRQIGELLRNTAEHRATLAVCTDIEEALEIADRIVVFNHGNYVGEHSIDHIDMPLLIQQIAAAPQ